MVNKIKYFKDKPVLAEIIDLIIICIIALMIGKLLITYIILTGYVPSGSMETTIMTGDRILADRMAYWNAEPERGDIVVFYAPDKSKHFQSSWSRNAPGSCIVPQALPCPAQCVKLLATVYHLPGGVTRGRPFI